MPEIIIDAAKMQEAAAKFGDTSDRLKAISEDLDETIQDLEGNWEGISKQAFYKHFLDLKKYLESFADLSASISKEMNTMADQINKLDSDDFELDE